jgi:hypothetical protein
MHTDTDLIETKLRRNAHLLRGSNLPVALHAWPKCKLEGFCGIGLVDWSGKTDPNPIGDVFVGKDSELYHAVNRQLSEACKRLDLPFMSMA